MSEITSETKPTKILYINLFVPNDPSCLMSQARTSIWDNPHVANSEQLHGYKRYQLQQEVYVNANNSGIQRDYAAPGISNQPFAIVGD